jgi:DNA-binding beta-propeller fold protein YncE
MAMLPSGRFLYVGNQAENSITAFNFSGELIESTTHYTGPYSDGSPYSTSAKPIALAADPMGMYLFVACDDKSLNVYSIDSFSGGHLKKVESVSLPVAATALGIDPSGHFLYVGDSNGNVSPYSIDIATGSVSALTPSVIDSGVTAISIDSSGQFAYILCGPQTGAGGNNGAIHALKVNPDGIVTELPVGPWLANNPSAIAFTDAVQ